MAKKVDIKRYIREKRRSRCYYLVCLGIIGFAATYYALIANEYHYKVISFPNTPSIIVSLSLWTANFRSSCQNTIVNNESDIINSFNAFCQVLVKEIDGESLSYAAFGICSNPILPVISGHSFCTSIMSIANASIIYRLSLLISLSIALLGCLLSVFFDNIIAYERTRTMIIACFIGNAMLPFFGLMCYYLFSTNLTYQGLLGNVFSSDGDNVTSYSTGFILAIVSLIISIGVMIGVMYTIRYGIADDNYDTIFDDIDLKVSSNDDILIRPNYYCMEDLEIPSVKFDDDEMERLIHKEVDYLIGNNIKTNY